MAFRAEEEKIDLYKHTEDYLIPRSFDEAQSAKSKALLANIIRECGSFVESYPYWHPLVSSHNLNDPVTCPDKRCGYEGLDHTRFFANGFITCPYHDGQRIIDSVESLPSHPVATITAEYLEEPFHSLNCKPILVRCEWDRSLQADGMIPASIAVPLILEKELPFWTSAQYAETWESMRPYFLGTPHGSRSSLFVNQEEGQTIKKFWNALIDTGMFGPVH